MIERLELDVLRYDALVAQARALIPSLCPEWTDHNPSDPGITLVELFAWLTELLSYRLNRVPEKSYRVFLNLLAGSPIDPPPGDAGVADAIRRTVTALREIDRVVTVDDMAYLILEKWPRSEEARRFGEKTKLSPSVKRVRCQLGHPIILTQALRIIDLPAPGGILVGTNTLVGTEREARISLTAAPGHLSAMVIPAIEGWPESGAYLPDRGLLDELEAYLEPRRLLTAHLHVIGPRVLKIGISASLHLSSDGVAAQVNVQAEALWWAWLHPLTGGPEGTGWPFGRRIHVADLYQVLDGVAGIDYVENAKLLVGGEDQPAGVDMNEYEIAAKDSVDFTIVEWTVG